MNKNRRKKLEGIQSTLIAQQELLEDVRDDEQLAMDGVPENLQYTDQYGTMEEAVDAIEDALSSLQEACDSIDVAICA